MTKVWRDLSLVNCLSKQVDRLTKESLVNYCAANNGQYKVANCQLKLGKFLWFAKLTFVVYGGIYVQFWSTTLIQHLKSKYSNRTVTFVIRIIKGANMLRHFRMYVLLTHLASVRLCLLVLMQSSARTAVWQLLLCVLTHPTYLYT